MLRDAGSGCYQGESAQEARQGSVVGAKRRSSLISLTPMHTACAFCAGFSQVTTALAHLHAKPDLPACCVLFSPNLLARYVFPALQTGSDFACVLQPLSEPSELMRVACTWWQGNTAQSKLPACTWKGLPHAWKSHTANPAVSHGACRQSWEDGKS